MASIANASIEDFKALFTRLPYLPVYVSGQAYFKGDIVYVAPNFYISLTDANTAPVTDNQKWALYDGNVDDYITDADILEAFSEARINFNPQLFSEDATALKIFYYLAAHYLIIDLNNASNPFAMGYMSFTQSKSVGSVSESYGLPQWILNSPRYSMYATTGFGRKFLSLIYPYITGQIIFTPGRTTYG